MEVLDLADFFMYNKGMPFPHNSSKDPTRSLRQIFLREISNFDLEVAKLDSRQSTLAAAIKNADAEFEAWKKANPEVVKDNEMWVAHIRIKSEKQDAVLISNIELSEIESTYGTSPSWSTPYAELAEVARKTLEAQADKKRLEVQTRLSKTLADLDAKDKLIAGFDKMLFADKQKRLGRCQTANDTYLRQARHRDKEKRDLFADLKVVEDKRNALLKSKNEMVDLMNAIFVFNDPAYECWRGDEK